MTHKLSIMPALSTGIAYGGSRSCSNHHLKFIVFQRVEFSTHFFPTVLAPRWEDTGLRCLSQVLGRNSFQGCSPGSREQGQHLPTHCNPKSRAWAEEEPRPRSFWESFLVCSAALWWQQLWLRVAPTKHATEKISLEGMWVGKMRHKNL